MKQVAFVTGGNRGIGRAIALRLGKMGYAVAIGYGINKDKADETVQVLRENGGTAVAFACDVSDAVSVAATIKCIEQQLGEVAVLINNAGIAQQKLFTDITDAEWDRMIRVHLNGTFYTCRAVLPAMLRRHRGVIVNISSIWGQVGGSCEVHYSAAKAGVIGLTKALAQEVGPSGIRVNCVAPGVIQTDMLSTLDDDALHALEQETPLGRLGTPQDIANAVAFLVSEEASFITGQVLAPNGGIVL